MYQTKSLSLVFPAKNEEENIGNAIKDFKKLKIFDEIIVVDNNCTDNTAAISRKLGARVVKEKKAGYGFAIRRGLKSASKDYIVICEPDGTFNAKDTLRLLKFADKYDMVTGSRTNPKFIKKGANMSLLLKTGNISLAKFLQLLFQTSSLSDCGCTFRLIKKNQLDKFVNKFTVGKSYFLPEFVILNKLYGGSIHELPVAYQKRIGISKITGSKIKAVKVGIQMFKLIIYYRVGLIKSD